MTRALKWRLVIGLVIVFLAGMATGLFAGAWHARNVVTGRHSAHFHHRMEKRLTRELNLTPEQARQAAPILDRLSQELETIREETSQRVRQTMNQSHSEMVPLLTPEQREKLEKMKARHHRILRKRGHHHPRNEH